MISLNKLLLQLLQKIYRQLLHKYNNPVHLSTQQIPVNKKKEVIEVKSPKNKEIKLEKIIEKINIKVEKKDS